MKVTKHLEDCYVDDMLIGSVQATVSDNNEFNRALGWSHTVRDLIYKTLRARKGRCLRCMAPKDY